MHDDLMALMYGAAGTAPKKPLTKDEALAAYVMALTSGSLLFRNNPRVSMAFQVLQRTALRDWDDIWDGIIKEAPQLRDGGAVKAMPPTTSDIAQQIADLVALLPKSHGVVAPPAA